MRIINKLICHFKGHKGLQRSQECISIYQKIKDYGTFGYEFPYVYEGRLYRCSRCGELCICRGITSWELEDLISDTLKDLPKGCFEDMWNGQDYDVCRIYQNIT